MMINEAMLGEMMNIFMVRIRVKSWKYGYLPSLFAKECDLTFDISKPYRLNIDFLIKTRLNYRRSNNND